MLELVAVPAMVAMGGLVALQSDLNGRLAGELGSGLRAGVLAAVVSFGSGLVVLAVLALLVPRIRRGGVAIARAARSGALRPWQLLGGVAGASLVASQGITVGTIGVALFIVAVVAGQTSSGLVVDHVGLGPAGRRAVTGTRVLGAALTLAAVVVSVSGRLDGAGALTGAALLLALLPLLAGAATSWQQAVNGRVSAEGGPMAAALVNFVVGTACLVLLLGLSFAVDGELTGVPGDWWLFTGGLMGVVFISGAALLVKVHGVLVLGLCTVAGQVVASLVIQGVAGEHLDATTVVGGACSRSSAWRSAPGSSVSSGAGGQALGSVCGPPRPPLGRSGRPVGPVAGCAAARPPGRRHGGPGQVLQGLGLRDGETVPPRCAGCQTARVPASGRWRGSRCTWSSMRCNVAPSSRVPAAASATPASAETSSGGPTTSVTGRPRRTSGRCLAVRSRCGPHTATGSSGAPVSRASATAPGIRARTVQERLTPASGNTPTASPSRSSRRAWRYAAAGARRSTGTCPMPVMRRREAQCSNTSCRARNRTRRPLRSAVRPTSRKSRKLTWFAASTTGPCRGTWSSPVSSTRRSSARRVTRPAPTTLR